MTISHPNIPMPGPVRHALQFFFEPLNLPDLERPDRRLMWLALRSYHVVTRLLVMVILITVGIYSPWIAGIGAIAYIALLLAFKHWMNIAKTDAARERIGLTRALVYIFGVTVFIISLYVGTDYVVRTGGSDALWLFYVLAVFVVCQYGSTRWVVQTMALSAGLMFLTVITRASVSGQGQLSMLLTGLTEVAWLVLFGATFHLLIRCNLDRAANQKLLVNLQAELAANSHADDEAIFLARAVNTIARNLSCPHVNVFELQADGALKCVAAVTPGDQDLVGSLVVEQGRGIVSKSLHGTRHYFSNDVEKCECYYPHPAFPATKSELAASFTAGDRATYVLDIQVHQTRFFLESDLEFFRAIADYLGYQLVNLKFAQTQRRLSQLATKMATAAAATAAEPDKDMLQAIADTARLEFNADIVTLHERNPVTNKVERRVYSGEFLDERSRAAMHRLHNLADRLAGSVSGDFFHADVAAADTDPAFNPRAGSYIDLPSFAEREHIRSRAILSLGDGGNGVGNIFINFRQPREFPESERGIFKLISHLATLAIQNSQRIQRDRFIERERLAADLHDSIKNKAYFVHEFLTRIAGDARMEADQRVYVDNALFHLSDLRHSARLLGRQWSRSWTDDPQEPQNLRTEISTVVADMNEAFGHQMAFSLSAAGASGVVSSAYASHVREVLTELLLNALRHSGATRVLVEMTLLQAHFSFRVTDDGTGFDVEKASMSGLNSAHRRIQHLGGGGPWMASSPGLGTSVVFEIPATPAPIARKELHDRFALA
jgi:GAF domain-containing protein/anti-sigma regulatory factor (Ser/Thr protein kinase)